jgi:hypothetical protein
VALTIEKRKSFAMVAVASAALTESGEGANEIAGGIFHVGIGHLVLVGVGKFRVAHRAGNLFESDRTTPSLPLAPMPMPAGHFTAVALADGVRPSRIHVA